MHLPTHALLSWLVAESSPSLERRDRALVLAAGIVPDLDATTLVFGVEAYQRWHHVILHNGLAAGVFAVVGAGLAQRRVAVLLLALFSYHLHMLCDLAGSAGPDGSLWPIPYLVPFDPREWIVSWQWGLASWQNVLVTLGALAACAHLGNRRGRTLVEVISRRADAAVVEVLRRRWPFQRT